MKKQILPMLAMIAVISTLTGCVGLMEIAEPTKFGIPQSEWNTLTAEQQQEVIRGQYKLKNTHLKGNYQRSISEPPKHVYVHQYDDGGHYYRENAYKLEKQRQELNDNRRAMDENAYELRKYKEELARIEGEKSAQESYERKTAADKYAKERADRDIADQEVTRVAKEKAERDAADRFVKERADHEATVRATKEKEEQEAANRMAKEREEQRAREQEEAAKILFHDRAELRAKAREENAANIAKDLVGQDVGQKQLVVLPTVPTKL